MSKRLSAVVLAGGRATAEFTTATGVVNRALVELAPDRSMLDFVLRALYDSETIDRIVVVGKIACGELNAGSPSSRDAARIVAPGETLIDNILIGFASLGVAPDERVLLVTSDIPFITSTAVDDFVTRSAATGADFCYPIVPMPEYNRQYPAMKRTTLKMRDGEFTGGNVILVRAGVLTSNPDAVRGAYAGRKSVFRIGHMLGWGLLLRVVISQVAVPRLLTIAVLERGVGRSLGPGVTAKAIVTNHASIGTDVDKPEDVTAAREILRETNCAES